MSTKRSRWTDEQIATLRRLHGTKPLREIAVVVGKPIGSVTTKVMRLGLAKVKPPWTKHEATTLREMIESGKTSEDVAAALGRPLSAVQRKRQAMGLVKWRQQPRHDEAKVLANLLEDVVLLLRTKAPHREILEAIYEARAGARDV